MRFTFIVLIIIGVVFLFFYFIMLPLIQEKITTQEPTVTDVKPTNTNAEPEEVNENDSEPDDTQDEPNSIKIEIPEPGVDMREDEKQLPNSWLNIRDDSDMLLVRAGTFIRGSNELRNHNVEHPVQKIYISSFYIDKYKITNRQYRKFMESGGYERQAYWPIDGWKYKEINNWTRPAYWNDGNFAGENKPVVGISWFEAYAYAKWAGKRLLTEVEWEKAARGYHGQKYPWGDVWKDSACNWGDRDRNNPKMRGLKDGFNWTAPVNAYEEYKSPFGVVQLSGNTFEWVYDWWGPYYFSNVVAKNEKLFVDPVNFRMSETQPWRVIKGGAFDMPNYFTEPSYRHASHPFNRENNIGFRCSINANEVKKIISEGMLPDNRPD